MTDRDALPPVRVLFLCTHNAARSQIAEALLARRGEGRFEAASAGTEPAAEVHPMTLEALRRAGIEWHGHPKSIDALAQTRTWDLVITVCDRAREGCPSLPGRPVTAHWSISDPAAVEGDEQRDAAFWDAVTYIGRRIDLLCALSDEKLRAFGLEEAVREISASAGAAPVAEA